MCIECLPGSSLSMDVCKILGNLHPLHIKMFRALKFFIHIFRLIGTLDVLGSLLRK